MFYEPKNGHGFQRDPFRSLIAPRPIGWISSVSTTGVANLAPFSFFNALAAFPPVLMFAAASLDREDGRKDSWRNAEVTGDFVYNMVTWDLREKMNVTSDRVASDVDEFELAGLTKAPSQRVKAPRVLESPVQMECRYRQTILIDQDPKYEAGPIGVVIGEVVGIHIADHILEDGRVKLERARPIARLGYAEYTVVDTIFRMLPTDLTKTSIEP